MSPHSPLLAIFSAIGVISLIIVWYKTKNRNSKNASRGQLEAKLSMESDNHDGQALINKKSVILNRKVVKQNSGEINHQVEKEMVETVKKSLKPLAPKAPLNAVETEEDKAKKHKARIERQRLEMVSFFGSNSS